MTLYTFEVESKPFNHGDPSTNLSEALSMKLIEIGHANTLVIYHDDRVEIYSQEPLDEQNEDALRVLIRGHDPMLARVQYHQEREELEVAANFLSNPPSNVTDPVAYIQQFHAALAASRRLDGSHKAPSSAPMAEENLKHRPIDFLGEPILRPVKETPSEGQKDDHRTASSPP